MKKLFYVESDQITRKAFQIRLKGSSWELYTLENMEEFSFRYNDFVPDMLFFSDKLKGDGQALKVAEEAQIPVAFVGFEKDNENIDRPLFKKPIDIMNLENLLDQFYEEMKNI